MLNNKIFITAIFMTILNGGCASFGNVSMGYEFSKERIWEAMKDVAVKEFGGIAETRRDPALMITNTRPKDKEFGLDKSLYEARMTLTGFSRPYVVDVEFRVYPDGVKNKNYTVDDAQGGRLLKLIKTYLDQRGNETNLLRDFKPY